MMRISVRNLVEFLYRGGDIDSRRRGGRERQAMDAGSRIHRKIQRQMGGSYESEVSLRKMVRCGSTDIVVEGRADGIYQDWAVEYLEKVWSPSIKEIAGQMSFGQEENGELSAVSIPDRFESLRFLKKKLIYIVDEIKGVYRSLGKIKEPKQVHKAQALCYAYMYATDHNLPGMGIQMTYANLETEEIKRFYDWKSIEELECWFSSLMDEYAKWAELEIHFQEELKASIEPLSFPFSYRPGQKKLALSVYRTIEKQERLLIQAPTGTGKTMSTLYPALKALGAGYGDRIFYLTAKTITRTVATEALEILRKQGLRIKSVTITAKEKICPLETCTCNPDACPYAKGHFDRVNEALYDLLTADVPMNRENIFAYAEKHQVCAFEFNLDLSLWSQAIICDYNYVFDPNVYLKRFFSENTSGRYLFLIDEAHNLPERARSMYSAFLVKEDVLAMEKICRTLADALLTETPEAITAAKSCIRALRKLNKELLSWKKQTDTVTIIDDIDGIYEDTLQVQSALSSFLEETRNAPPEELLDFFFALRHFNGICEIMDGNYVNYATVEDEKFYVKLLCANPAANISRCCKRAKSTIFFSATMLPMPYYKTLLTTEEMYRVYVDSPFNKEKRLLAIADDVTSLYSQRDDNQYKRILNYILELAQRRIGNYMVFFPSYQYMTSVAAVYTERYGTQGPFSLLMQERGFSEEERDNFLEQFSLAEGSGQSLVAFCVLGGIFSEGIDLTGNKLIGAVIVGTGLGQISIEGELLRDFFTDKGWDGYAYAYRFPGINRVFQAAGRVIRTAEDEGVVLLLDHRMLQESHVRLFPMDWDNYYVTNQENFGNLLDGFWKSRDK